jgi:preprotein translocase subunit SecA
VDLRLGHLLGKINLWASPLRRLELRSFAALVDELGAAFQSSTDDTLKLKVLEFRQKLVREGLTRQNVATTFAIIREASGRTLAKRHYPVQVMAGYALLRGYLAEMATGEGKTLTAALPAATVALAGIPTHIVTVNEYLAKRDAKTLEPLYAFLGLTSSWIDSEQDQPARAKAYGCDITHCVNNDLVFDYLKDGLAGSTRAEQRWQDSALPAGQDGGPANLLLRGLHFAIVDEADSIFIDEARTPLIISSERNDSNSTAVLQLARDIALGLPSDCYVLLERERNARLTAAGELMVEKACVGMIGPWRYKKAREELIRQALASQYFYLLNKHYVVLDGKIQIIDEFTGRIMKDRSWEQGLHQLIETKENLPLTRRRDTIARITFQRFFRRYLHLAAMTGTGAEVADEIQAVFGLATVRIPTHRPVARISCGDKIFLRATDRWSFIVERVRELKDSGRAILVGTRSVEASEVLSGLLSQAGLAHALLNAKQDADEASVIAKAGNPGSVTVATNMAGRGTDILLHPTVASAGGLHVILSEYHESRRIDRQLFGRAGRQGDPGSHESATSLQDELFLSFCPRISALVFRHLSSFRLLPFWLGLMLRILAQTSAERFHARIRKRTLESEKSIDKSLAFSGKGE